MGEAIPTITVSAENDSGDIYEYVRTTLAKIKNLKKVPKELRLEIISALIYMEECFFLNLPLQMRLSQKTLKEDEQGMPKSSLLLGEHKSHTNRRVRTCIERERDAIMSIA